MIGGIVAGLNHAMHKESYSPPEKSLLDTAGEWVTDYFDYNGDGKVAGWDYVLGVADVGITIFDIVTVSSGEGVAAHLALKSGAKTLTKTSFNISNKSIKGYAKVKDIGGKYAVYSKEVKASNLKGQSKSIYYKVFNKDGNTVKMYKNSYRPDGKFYHRRNMKPEFQNMPRYSK